jgi:AmmeMemoRadiSam system protein B
MRRQAAVAGVFYPSDQESVAQFIEEHKQDTDPVEAKAVIVPHAGYVYSGATAVKTFSNVKIPDTVILIGPNHTGNGPAISVFPEGSWSTPMGDVDMNRQLVEKLCEHPYFHKDVTAHAYEHSLEVILPILKYFNPQVKVVCITVKYISFADLKAAAENIASVFNGLVVVSSDFNHFEDVETTEKKDQMAIDKLMAMDAQGLYDIIADESISMCGVIPACIGLIYSLGKNADEPVFIEHTHSGVVNGDNNKVVGYAGLYFK